MLERAFHGSKLYWSWMALLLTFIAIGIVFYWEQFNVGLATTGLTKDVSWGLYIAQFTFLVGVAASAVMVVLPYYLHNYKKFAKITILGEFLAIGAVIMCMTFIFVDMGQPTRVANIFLHPTPNSPMFWDSVSIFGYLILNIIISQVSLSSEKNGVAPPNWIKPIIIISIPWAISIHTVTAFLYSGLAARPFWMSAIMAPRFLATAFAAGPALLIILAMLLRKMSRFDVGSEAIQKLSIIAAYAMCANIFFLFLEMFTAFYSGMHHHMVHFEFLYLGLEGNSSIVPFMWTSAVLAIASLIILLVPKFRKKEHLLLYASIALFLSIWLDKGLGMIVAGLTPNPLGHVVNYWPTLSEFMISVGIYALGLFIVTVLYKIALSVRRQLKED